MTYGRKNNAGREFLDFGRTKIGCRDSRYSKRKKSLARNKKY